MKKNGRLACGLGAGVAVLALICVAVVGIVYWQSRSTAFASRPLVLIHSPVNHERVQTGERVQVHATARSQRGLRRIELWADDVFVGAQDAEEGQRPNMLVFAGSWVPTVAANHVLIVRAIAANGTEGQASIVVAASDAAAAAEPQTVEVAEGAPGGESAPGGDGLEGSSGDAASEPPTPEEGSEAPGPEGEPPEGFSLLLFAYELVPGLPLGEAEPFDRGAEPTGLRLEFLSLTTSAAYDQLQCYAGFGGAPPIRYPDQDGDPSTDESFVAEGDAGAGWVNWNVEGLSGANMPVIMWPRNQDLPISVWCVGIAGGGTDAVELGRWEREVTPEYWTGMTLTAEVPGSYMFTFAIRRAEGGGRGFDAFLDENMDGPSNVWLDDSQSTLNWEYTQPDDEEPIDGFRIYLNGSLQFVERSGTRERRLPYEWFHPACGTTYTFGVSTYWEGLPDGPESYPRTVALEQPEADCQREVLITFLTLETFDLGGDQEEHFIGDVGPTYGYLYANEQQVTFDGGILGPGLGTPEGFSDNSSYDLWRLSSNLEWQFSDNPEISVMLPPDEGTLQFGFHIDDRDSGHCDEPGDVGCDDVLCERGFTTYYSSETSEHMDRHNEGELRSEDGRCLVRYQWGPAVGSPTGAGGAAGGVPLPWIDVEGLDVNDGSGQVSVRIRNTGAAGWRDQDLSVELQSREGVSLGIYTWPGFTLEAGERTVLEQADMRLEAPFDACAVIDPYNDVLERHEEGGSTSHGPVCAQLPDLIISDVTFEGGDEGVGRLHVIVENQGDGALEGRTVSLQVILPDGTPLGVGGAFPDIALGTAETVPLVLEGVTSATRGQMGDGYSVVVNPDGTVAESDSTNNSFEVDGARRLKFAWTIVSAPYQQADASGFSMEVGIASGEAHEPMGSWEMEEVNWSDDDCTNSRRNCNKIWIDEEYATEWFDIFGDEVLEVSAVATHSMIVRGIETWSYDAGTDWGAGPLDPRRHCAADIVFTDSGPQEAPGQEYFILDWMAGFYDTGVWWGVGFQVCHE